jgi:hypothetical protein
MRLLTLATCLCLSANLRAANVTAPHVQVNYNGIEPAQAEAIAQTLSAARSVYVDDFSFDMPETITAEVTCGPGNPTKLYTDGNDRVFLSMPSKAKLAPPQKSGTFIIYGLCHELGHMAMYRTLKQRDWLSSAAAEGWAHYTGSVVVDRVYALKGESLWPEKYDYRQDGTARLDRALKSGSLSDVDRAAEQWRQLEQIVGPKVLVTIFQRWQAATIDPANPTTALMAATLSKTPDKQQALEAWWKTAAPLLVEARQASVVKAQTLDRAKLTGQPLKVGADDDKSDSKRSIAGSGHIREFAAPSDGQWYVVAVSVFGSRYGAAGATHSTFELALCDSENKPIISWEHKYAAFPRGEPKWTRFEVPPTQLPAKFNVCLNFRPTASNGVYVHIDSSTQGNSKVGLPGKESKPLDQGNWMIRLELDQPKAADALSTPKS